MVRKLTRRAMSVRHMLLAIDEYLTMQYGVAAAGMGAAIHADGTWVEFMDVRNVRTGEEFAPLLYGRLCGEKPKDNDEAFMRRALVIQLWDGDFRPVETREGNVVRRIVPGHAAQCVIIPTDNGATALECSVVSPMPYG